MPFDISPDALDVAEMEYQMSMFVRASYFHSVQILTDSSSKGSVMTDCR